MNDGFDCYSPGGVESQVIPVVGGRMEESQDFYEQRITALECDLAAKTREAEEANRRCVNLVAAECEVRNLKIAALERELKKADEKHVGIVNAMQRELEEARATAEQWEDAHRMCVAARDAAVYLLKDREKACDLLTTEVGVLRRKLEACNSNYQAVLEEREALRTRLGWCLTKGE